VPLHLSPRGQRTLHTVNALSRIGEVSREGAQGLPGWLAGDSTRTRSPRYRKAARRLLDEVLLDKYELSARSSLRHWDPSVDGAVLIGHPFSPLPVAAQRLAARDIPYLVDTGDPWILTNPRPDGGRVRQARGARSESKLWSSARGAIVTTAGQGAALSAIFPQLRVLVRPNGFTPVGTVEDFVRPPQTRAQDGELRLAHYGSLHGPRVDFAALLQLLAESQIWKRVVLHQYGPDWAGTLGSVSSQIRVEHHPPIPWDQVVGEAHQFDAAVVIGWRYPAQLPSKAVQYLTLPIPRLAMVNADPDDALATYVADKPGWLAVSSREDAAAARVAEHLAADWSIDELAPPEAESWEAVEQVLGEFAVATLG
jgi:hypothetical protein